MALTPEQREVQLASLATARAARAAKRVGNPEPPLADTETNVALSEALPDIDPAIVARAQAQLVIRADAEKAVLLRQRAEEAGVDIDKPTGLQSAATEQVAKEDLMARAARQKALAGKDEQPMVKVRITKMGDGKVSMGIHVAGIGEAYYEKGEMVDLPLDVAQRIESRGFAEIQD